MERADLEKQAKVLDMMLTGHSILSRQYQFGSKALEILLAAGSTILVALTFADAGVLEFFGMSAYTGKIVLGVCAILVFFLSVVSLIVDWEGKAGQHKEAFDTLIRQKAEWRAMLANYDTYDTRERAEFSKRSSLVLGNLVPIPDAKFNCLKAKHHRKVLLSKTISANPGVSYPALRCRLFLRGVKRAFQAPLPDDGNAQ